MWFAIVLIFVFAVSLIPGVQQKFEQTIEGISGALTQGPLNTVSNFWVKVLAISAVAAGGLWIVETKVAKHEGVAPPRLPDLPGLPTPPGVSTQSGYTVAGGPVSFGSSVGAATGQAPPLHVYEPPSNRGGGSGGRGTAQSRAASKAAIARSRADIADARLREEQANQNRKGAGFSVAGRSGRSRYRRAA